ncbi:MAG: hypothetical protein AAGJ70_08410, partial [Pseudomonadota bacterium]
MSPDSSKYHPDRVIDNFLSGTLLAPSWRSVIGFIVVLLAWYGLVSSAISLLTSMSWVKDAGIFLYNNAHYLKPFFAFIAEAVHAITESWRQVTEPLYRLLFGWLPFQLPREVLDLCVIASIMAGAQVRAWFATRHERRFMRVIRAPEAAGSLSVEGRVAVVKRLLAAQEVFRGNDNEKLKDKAESEFVLALEEMTGGINPQDYDFLEDAMFAYKPDEFEDFLYRCALAEETVQT